MEPIGAAPETGITGKKLFEEKMRGFENMRICFECGRMLQDLTVTL